MTKPPHPEDIAVPTCESHNIFGRKALRTSWKSSMKRVVLTPSMLLNICFYHRSKCGTCCGSRFLEKCTEMYWNKNKGLMSEYVRICQNATLGHLSTFWDVERPTTSRLLSIWASTTRWNGSDILTYVMSCFSFRWVALSMLFTSIVYNIYIIRYVFNLLCGWWLMYHTCWYSSGG